MTNRIRSSSKRWGSSQRGRLIGAAALLALSAACTSAPSLNEVLAAESGVVGASIDEEVRRLTQLADGALAEGAPVDAAAQLAAAQVLAAAADMRLVRGQWQAATAAGLNEISVDDLVGLDDTLGSDQKAEILGLAKAGMDYAEAAEAGGEPSESAESAESAESSGAAGAAGAAAYYRCFHLSLVAWAEGATTAIFRGRGPLLAKLLKKAVESDPLVADAGPLRVRGRFLDRAPWPYGDRKVAIELLQRAVLEAPIAVNFQFLGDALWSAGQKPDALDAWRAGLEAGRAIESGLELEGPEAPHPWETLRVRLLEARISASERER